MSVLVDQRVATNGTTPDQVYFEGPVNEVDLLQAEKRYGEERAKRLRDEGDAQFVEPGHYDKFRHFQEDPWIDEASVPDARTKFDDNQCELLILGAGFGGLSYAVRMIQAGIDPKNIRIIDTAGDFGGTWYYNRYPGLMCDVESYLYLPLLEEMGYMPKHHYSYAEEIRNYANLIAEKWNLRDSAVFLTKAEKLVWQEESKEWQVELVQIFPGRSPQTLHIRSQFVAAVSGPFNWPKLPGFPGILDFKGKIFHPSRWDYSITGGSQADPSLTKLQDKRVAIVGTGATAIQAVPHLAHWSKHLYVVQRTPSGVDHRNQRETDPYWYRKEVANSKGWQRERLRNFHSQFTTGKRPLVDLVNDRWTNATTWLANFGNILGPKSMEEFPAYLQTLHTLDLPRQNRVRALAEQIVTDQSVAKKLQAWYPTWCKRPCFHDDYLPAFNRDNVTLVDTVGKGIDRITSDSIIVGDTSYPVDVIILATGYRAPFSGNPAAKGNMTIVGRDGLSMSDEWNSRGPKTLHGVMDHQFPNLFLSGPWQASVSPNYLFTNDSLGKHSAYILTEAKRRAGGKPFAVVPTTAAVEDWGNELLKRSAPMAAMAGCTPGYFNMEGEMDRAPAEAREKMAKGGIWGHGIEDYIRWIEGWREEGNMQGVEVQL